MNGINYEQVSEAEALDHFNKNYNISYYDDNLPKPSNELIFKHYISSCVIYAFAMLLFLFNPFYKNLFENYSYFFHIIVALYISYIVIAPVFLFIIKPKTIYASHSIELINYFIRITKREGFNKSFNAAEFIQWLKPTYKQKQSFVLYFIKFFFAPQLVVWSISHFGSFLKAFYTLTQFNLYNENQGINLNTVLQSKMLLLKYRDYVYAVCFQFLYFLDVFFFTIGYCTELTFLKNRIRSVDSTVLGLFFCLICYKPFSKATTAFVAWNHPGVDLNLLNNQNAIINWIFYLIAVVLIAIYASASIALCTKASNLTNRGTCKIFPYNIVRHPAYASKVLFWWISTLIIFKRLILSLDIMQISLIFISAVVWTFIYYMRAITEERHLLLDPEYRAYTKKVKYRFLPYIW